MIDHSLLAPIVVPFTPTADDIHLMQHAIGLQRRGKKWSKPYRNHFVASLDSPDYERWQLLTAAGYAVNVGRGNEISGGMPVFAVTDAGRELAIAATKGKR